MPETDDHRHHRAAPMFERRADDFVTTLVRPRAESVKQIPRAGSI